MFWFWLGTFVSALILDGTRYARLPGASRQAFSKITSFRSLVTVVVLALIWECGVGFDFVAFVLVLAWDFCFGSNSRRDALGASRQAFSKINSVWLFVCKLVRLLVLCCVSALNPDCCDGFEE